MFCILPQGGQAAWEAITQLRRHKFDPIHILTCAFMQNTELQAAHL